MIELSRLSPDRLLPAIGRRLLEIPHRLAWSNSEKGRLNKKKLENYKNRYEGEVLYLIANGPSLKHMDLSILKDKYTMCMNRFYMYFETAGFVPNFLVCMQDLVLDQFKDDFENLDIDVFYNWRFRGVFSKAVFIKESYSILPFFQKDVTNPTHIGGTVSFVCLQLAYYMGFKKVVIIGMDHNFKEKGTPNKTETRTYEKDESHFDPNYFPKGSKWKLPDLDKSEFSYALARDAFNQDGRTIVDATINGKCDVFKKEIFEKTL